MKRFTTKEKLLLLSPLLVFGVFLVSHFRGDKLDRELRRSAGAGAVDCGIAQTWIMENHLVEKRAIVDSCVVAAFGSGAAFRARYETYDGAYPDDFLSYGISGTRTREIHFYDQTRPRFIPHTIWGRNSGHFSSCLCPKPEIVNDRLKCTADKCSIG